MDHGGRQFLQPINSKSMPDFDNRVVATGGNPGQLQGVSTWDEQFMKREKRKEKETLLSKSLNSKMDNEVTGSLRPMERPLSVPKEKFPKHVVSSISLGGLIDNSGTGKTFSTETDPNEGVAELEVLKAILNREGYLEKLRKSVQTIGKKMKPEVVDIMDYVRTATLDVIDAILKWRQAKRDHDAAFKWNGINYLLKMSSDLDYLMGYLAIKKWIGFDLNRNPFMIPYPLEKGVELYAERVLDPKHIDTGTSSGFIVGGLPPKVLAQKYTPKGLNEMPVNESAKKSFSKFSSQDPLAQSFIPNADMVKIRQAELVILKEEEKFGAHSRDHEGHLMPILQAMTRIANFELPKDDRRSIEEPAHSSGTFALHSLNSDIGLAPPAWTPADEEKTQSNQFGESKFIESDVNISPVKKGEDRIGGVLRPLDQKGVETRMHLPIRPSLTSDMEFNRARKKKSLLERLDEITQLKADLAKQRAALERAEKASRKGTSSRQSNKSRGGTSFSAGESSQLVERATTPKSIEIKTEKLTETATSYDEASIETKTENITDALIEKKINLFQKEQSVSVEEVATSNELEHIKNEEDRMKDLKEFERKEYSKDRSREIERKRRLLTKEESVRTGPPPDNANAYDYYAIRVQKTIRGFICRCWVRWFRKAAFNATQLMQAGIRGWLSRIKVRRKRLHFRSCTNIQKIFRGWKARGVGAALAKTKNLGRSAVTCQRIVRGFLGRRRAIAKRNLDAAALAARSCVDPRTLQVSDVKEMGRRIQCAIEEPLVTPYPPDEVLHMIRIVIMIIQSARGLMGLSEYNFINARHYNEVDGEELTWMQAAKMLNRSERFLRLLRTMAYGPSLKPPRLIQFPPNAEKLYEALKQSDGWKKETFEQMGSGSKLASQIFIWLESITVIAIAQDRFISFLANSFPDWLPQLLNYRAEWRAHSFDSEIRSRCISTLESLRERITDDIDLDIALQKEIKTLEKETNESQEKQHEINGKITRLGAEQTKREEIAIVQMENKVIVTKKTRDMLIKKVKELTELMAEGDRAAEEELVDIRDQLTTQQIVVNEIEAQDKLLKVQCQKNVEQRKFSNFLPPEIKPKAIAAGESKALFIEATLKAQVLLTQCKVKDPSHLPVKFLDVYKKLEREIRFHKETSRKLFVAADIARTDYDTEVSDELKRNEKEQNRNKNKMIPSDAEMQEERKEDEIESQLERLKTKQFLPDNITKVPFNRPRPIIVALGLDLPAYARKRILERITGAMPGVFVSLSIEKNMGLDVKVMQTVLDSKRSIIMTVDHGLTRLTRTNFLKAFDLVTKTLIPRPYVAIAIGDDRNKRTLNENVYFGANKIELERMRDRVVKGSLESMAMVLDELIVPEISSLMQAKAAQLVPSSASLVIVMEAIFVILSDSDEMFVPETSIATISWRISQNLLCDPHSLAKRLREIKRGSFNLQRCETLHQYLVNRHWPHEEDVERLEDKVLNLLALYVEKFYLSETATAENGGCPVSSLSKSSMKGIQTVVTVRDSIDPEDLVATVDAGAGWRAASTRLMHAILQDMRVCKTINRINGKIFNITAYRQEQVMYFDTYDTETSQLLMTYVRMDEVPHLIAPDASSLSAGTAPPTPTNEEELARSLIKLLRFQKINRDMNGRTLLVCQRDYSYLYTINMLMDGHRIVLKCYEAALGELHFTGYIPEYSAKVSFHVEEQWRLKFLRYGDPILEHHCLEDPDGKKILPYVVDRLKLKPSRKVVAVKGINTYDDFRGNLAMQKEVKSQGFKLNMRIRGGPGFFIWRKLIKVSGVKMALALRSSTPSKTLRVILYEPFTSNTLECRISKFLRTLLLGTIDDNCIRWIKKLERRIKINWRGKHEIIFDQTLYRTIKKVDGRHLILSIILVDENFVKIQILDAKISLSFSKTISREDLLQFLMYVPPADVIKKEFGKKVGSSSVRNILKYIRKEVPTENAEKTNDINPDLLEQSMLSLLSNQETVVAIIDKLVQMLKPKVLKSYTDGYYFSEPFTVNFEPEKVPNKEAYNTSLKHDKYLKQSECDGSLDSVIRCRRQLSTVVMEIALNDLALQKSREAEARIEADLLATEELDGFMETVEDDQLETAVLDAATDASNQIMGTIEQRLLKRISERIQPGTIQQEHRNSIMLLAADNVTQVEVDLDSLSAEQRAIVGRGEHVVYEGGVRASFRDFKSHWHGHVSIKVYETVCWMGDEEGLGRRLRFVIYDPQLATYFEGAIRNNRHLKEVLGPKGFDLIEEKKTTEMILFIAKYRMFLQKVDNRSEEEILGIAQETKEIVNENNPLNIEYVVDFEKTRVYDFSKVTPVNAAAEEDEAANEEKYIDVEKVRGKKLLRLARRVSGLLMQLIVFELPAKDEDQEPDIKPKTEKPIDENSNNEKPSEEKDLNMVDDYAENRLRLVRVAKYEVPNIRVIGYDPLSKRKVILDVTKEMLLDVSGGIYSPFLDPIKRTELAKILCEAMILTYPKNKPFELFIPFSGANISAAVLGKDLKSTRSNADRTIKRPGKLFKNAMKISKLELIVSLFSNPLPGSNETQLVINFYSVAISESNEMVLTQDQQIDRVGRTVASCPEGNVRAALIRRLLRFFQASIQQDVDDPDKKTLFVELLDPTNKFGAEYNSIGTPDPGENVRPVGIPAVFLPLNTCGNTIHRRGMTIENHDPSLGTKNYVVTVFTKSNAEGPEKGLVIKIYESGFSETAVLHLGHTEMLRILREADEPELLKDIVNIQLKLNNLELDQLENSFEDVTEKGNIVQEKNHMVNYMVDLILKKIGIRSDPNIKILPYIKNDGKGKLPQ